MEILKAILSDEVNRKQLIKQFQQSIWDKEEDKDNVIDEILSELAYDLDFYEPDKELRKESTSYYGDDRLEAEIKSALQKIEQYNKAAD